MVRALVLSILALSEASQLMQGSCHGGSCPEATKESSVLMQRRNRGKQIPMRQAAQATANSGSVDLFQATAQLLRVGASPDVIEFTNNTLEALESDILPNLLHGYDIDSQMVNESFDKVVELLERWEDSKGSLVPLREAEADAIKDHNSCRQQEKITCEESEVCHQSCQHYNETYISTETDYLAITELIHHNWCEVYGNKSDPVWRTSITEKFSRYLLLGQRRIEEHKQLTDCVTECESKSWRSQVESGLLQVNGKALVAVDSEGEGQASAALSWNPCDEKQHAMEHASCALASHRSHLNTEVDDEWHLMTNSFNDIVANVKQREELRHRDFKAIEGIKCLLKHIVDRAGKPCDEEDEPGVADEIITECESYWQIDVHVLLKPWNITFPELPAKPEPVPSTPYPCTSEWTAAQYGHLSGSCFSDMPACMECPDVQVFDDDEEPLVHR
jgi:hypothetical protein